MNKPFLEYQKFDADFAANKIVYKVKDAYNSEIFPAELDVTLHRQKEQKFTFETYLGSGKIKIDMKRAKSDDVSSFGNWSTTISIESTFIENEYVAGNVIKSEIVYTNDEPSVWPI